MLSLPNAIEYDNLCLVGAELGSTTDGGSVAVHRSFIVRTEACKKVGSIASHTSVYPP